MKFSNNNEICKQQSLKLLLKKKETKHHNGENESPSKGVHSIHAWVYWGMNCADNSLGLSSCVQSQRREEHRTEGEGSWREEKRRQDGDEEKKNKNKRGKKREKDKKKKSRCGKKMENLRNCRHRGKISFLSR